ncbi:hypothetical protein BpHYR1_043653, partial [Brachionus plicatilis]
SFYSIRAEFTNDVKPSFFSSHDVKSFLLKELKVLVEFMKILEFQINMVFSLITFLILFVDIISFIKKFLSALAIVSSLVKKVRLKNLIKNSNILLSEYFIKKIQNSSLLKTSLKSNLVEEYIKYSEDNSFWNI